MVNFKLSSLVLIFLLLGNALVQGQQSTRINSGWNFLKGDLGGIWESVRPYADGSPEAVPIWTAVELPHCYNAEDAVDPYKNYYQGPAWYKNNLEVSNPYEGGRSILHFEGVGQKAEVYVYTTKVGEHVGGYDEWDVDITEAVANFKKSDKFQGQFEGKVPVSIRVDNSRDLEMIPSDMSDFNVYGGIYRYVNLLYTPALYIDKIFAEAKVDKKGNEGTVNLRGRLKNYKKNEAAKVVVELLDPNGKVVSHLTSNTNEYNGDINFGQLSIRKPKLWTPKTPNLYRVVTKVTQGDVTATYEDKIGFRHIEFQEHGPFFLNGERLLLRGTHRHEDHAGVGAAMTEEMMLEEMKLIKDMGVNFIRLGHYQQSPVILDACDSLGILVWEEIPWCRGGLGGETYKTQARRMLTNMIEQHYNHTSIIIWGLGNENDWPGDFSTFDKDAIRTFMKELNDMSHRLDSNRKTAIRRCDFCKDIVDVYSPSIWAGWYRGVYTDYKASSHEEMEKVNHFLHVEWGGDSHAGRHSENPDKVLAEIKGGEGTDERAGDASFFGGSARVSKDGDWSESYISNLFDWHLKEQETMPWLTGSAFWVFKDFSTPVRPDNPVPYVNQKGVIERDFTKKESYYIFQSYWSDKPMLHIYGHNWPVRWGDVAEKKMIKVYSNLDEVELFVNNVSLGKKKRNVADFPAAGLNWMVVLKEGENKIHAVGKVKGEVITDQITQIYQTSKWDKPHAMSLDTIAKTGDLVTVEVLLKDKNGNICLDAKNWVDFDLAGDGELQDNQGTSNGSKRIQLYNGRARIRVKSNSGKSVVSVVSSGLETKFLTLGSLL